MPEPIPVLSPAGLPRLPRSAALQATGTTVVSGLSTIAAWVVGMCLDALPVVVPPEVRLAFSGLTLIGVAWGVSYAATRMRESQWEGTGKLTGIKQAL